MKKIAIIMLYFCCLAISVNALAAEMRSVSEVLPEIILTLPENSEHVQYLGISGEAGDQITINQIDADILLIELFSMYCPYCQNAAPTVNELYEKMEKLQREDLKLKIIGIGANNTALEVDTFREGFDIQFPLFTDKDLSIYKTLAGEGTPTFIGCKKTADGTSVIFARKSGGFPDAGAFLEDVLRLSQVGE